MPEQKSGDEGAGVGRRIGLGAPPRAPRWVRVSAIAVGVLVLLVVIAKLTGLAGDHGPGRHMSGSSTSTVTYAAVQDGFR